MSEDRYTDSLNDKKPGEDSHEHMVRLSAALGKIKVILEQKFPEGSPFPANLYKNVQLWEKTSKPKPKEAHPPTPVQKPAGTEQADQAAAPPVTATVSTSTSGPAVAEVMDNPRQAQASAKKAASFLIEKEPQKAMGYRLMRGVRWDILEKAPPADGGKTQLQGPNPQQRTYFQNLVAQKDWKTALEKAEAAFASGANHFWLDLQRIIVTACKELGAAYAPVGNAVLIETAYFLKRVPEVVSMSFSDGAPFCDDATKDWINNDVAAAMNDGASAGRSSAGDPVDIELRDVNSLVSAGQFEQAMDLVQKAIRSSSSERDNFRRTIAIGSLLLKAKQPDIAVSVMESLDLKITTYHLDRWDPDIAVEAWSVLVQAYKVGKATKPQNIQAVIQEKQNTILSKISQIDPKKAFTLNK